MPRRWRGWSAAGWPSEFSLAGGHIRVAARNPHLVAAIAQTPNVDGPAGLRTAARYSTPRALLRLTGRGVVDALGGVLGSEPLLVPLGGPWGTVAVLTTPDVADSGSALNPGNRYPDWLHVVAARLVLPPVAYRPGRNARRVRCPLLVLVCAEDRSAPAAPAAAVAAAGQAPAGELVRIPGGHYQPVLGGHERAADAKLSFLRRHLLDRA